MKVESNHIVFYYCPILGLKTTVFKNPEDFYLTSKKHRKIGRIRK